MNKLQVVEKLKSNPKTRKFLEENYFTCDFTVFYNKITKKGRITVSPRKNSEKPKMKIIFINIEILETPKFGYDVLEQSTVKTIKNSPISLVIKDINVNFQVYPKFLGFIEKTGKLEHQLPPNYEYISEPGDLPCINYGVEQSDNSRKWIVRSFELIQEDLKQRPFTIHESIKAECKFFCDIDDKLNHNFEDFKIYIDKLRRHFCVLFPKFYQHEPVISQFIEHTFIFNTFVAVSEAEYNSAHIIFEIIVKETNTKICAPNAASQKAFWKEMVGAGFDKIDLAVYRNNSQLRVINSPKDGYCLRPLKSDYNLFYANGDTRYDEFNDYCVGFNYEEGQKSNYKLKIETNINSRRWYSHYDIVKMAKTIEKSSLTYETLAPFTVWREAVCRIYHFYHFISHEERQKMVLDFCRARGWNDHKADNENITLCSNFRSLCLEIGYNVKSMEEFFKPKYDINIVEMKKIKYPLIVPFNQEGGKRIFCLKSGTNTKKTLNFIKTFADKSVLFITYRRTLADELMRTGKFAGFIFAHYKEDINFDAPPKHLVVQLESLYKFEHILFNYEYVFLDESEALIGQFCHAFTSGLPKSFSILQEMFDEIMNTKKVVLVSANLGDETRNFIENYGLEYKIVENTFKDKNDWTYVDYKNPNHFINEIMKLAQEGKKLIIAINSKEKSVQLADKLDPQFNEKYETELIERMAGELKSHGKVLLLNADTIKDNPYAEPEKWVEFDFVIYTPAIEAGVNFIESHFDHICGYFINTTNTYESCYQMLFRCRNPKSKKIYLYTSRGEKLCDRDYITERELSVRNEFLKQYKKGKSYKPVYNARAHPLRKTIIYHQLKQNHSRYNFGVLLKRELEHSGIRHIEPEEVNDQKVEFNDKAFNIFVKTNVKYNSAGECINLISKLKIIGLNAKDIDLFDDCNNNAKTIDAIFNYYTIFNSAERLNPDQHVVAELAKYDIVDDMVLNEFVVKYWYMLNLNHNMKSFLAKKLRYKVQILNNILDRCFLSIRKVGQFYRIKSIDQHLLNKIEKLKSLRALKFEQTDSIIN